MKIDKLIADSDKAYSRYILTCDALAREAQKYILWDDHVSCQRMPSDGLCILATLPEGCEVYGMPECVCPVDVFFSAVKFGNSISPEVFKEISI